MIDWKLPDPIPPIENAYAPLPGLEGLSIGASRADWEKLCKGVERAVNAIVVEIRKRDKQK